VEDAGDDGRTVANADPRVREGDGFGNAYDADLSDHGIVAFVDLAKTKVVSLKTDGNAEADLDADGVVTSADLARPELLFFKKPGASAR